MLASIPRRPDCRARHPCVHFTAVPSPASAADKAFQRDDLDEAAIKLEAQIKKRRRRLPASRWRNCAARPTPRSRRTISRSGMRAARPDRRRGARRRRELAAARAHRAADPPGQRPRARDCCSSAPRPPPTSPISARNEPREEADASLIVGRTFGDRKLWRPALDALRLSLELREVADVRAHVREAARGARLPPARLLGRCGCGVAARLLPVLRGAAGQAHRLLAVRRGRRAGQAGALRRRQAALRRRPEARRALHRHACAPACRRPCSETLAKSAEFNDLCARPQAVRALHRQGLCAAAHRPARHSGGQRQHRGGRRSRSTASATAT